MNSSEDLRHELDLAQENEKLADETIDVLQARVSDLEREGRKLFSDLDAAIKAAQQPQDKRQYFYKVDACKAESSNSPDCICWHDEGTGPLSAGVGIPKSWRIKPQQPEPMSDERIDGWVSVPDKMPDSFNEWLCREIPEATIISNPSWWAPRLWNAMKRCAAAPKDAR